MKKYLSMITAVMLLGAGCSSSATPATPATPSATSPQAAVNAESGCDDLMTLAEAREVSGLAYTERSVSAQMVGPVVVTSCTYFSTDRTLITKGFSLLTRSTPSVGEAERNFEQSKAGAYTEGQELSGIGDRALWSPTLSQVSVLRGQTWLIVTAMNNQELATKVSKTVVPKLR